ncbi:hypothetical protein QE152_g7406 [Popillia japonica]|uniref:Uncharacterized protein n=1 Tax=Popillia japonica TaxID=7064 RepID=A0AAW1MEW3_POPJA
MHNERKVAPELGCIEDVLLGIEDEFDRFNERGKRTYIHGYRRDTVQYPTSYITWKWDRDTVQYPTSYITWKWEIDRYWFCRQFVVGIGFVLLELHFKLLVMYSTSRLLPNCKLC